MELVLRHAGSSPFVSVLFLPISSQQLVRRAFLSWLDHWIEIGAKLWHLVKQERAPLRTIHSMTHFPVDYGKGIEVSHSAKKTVFVNF
jgi:hypothetical protein